MLKTDATVVQRLRECRRCPLCQAEYGGAGRRDGVQPGVRQLQRPGEDAVGSFALVGRLVERPRLRCWRRTGPVCDRLGDLGLDPVPFDVLRCHRSPANLRPGQPARRHGAQLDDGQAGTAGENCGRLWPGARSNRRSRPARPYHTGQRFTASWPRGRWLAPALESFRLGILRGTREKTQPEVLANFETSLGVLRKVADITEDLVLPDFPFDAAAGIIIDAEAASAFESLFESGRITRLTAPEDRLGGYPGQVLLAKDYLRALRIRRPASVALDRLLSGFDAIVAPSLPTVAWPLDTAFDKVYPQFPGGTNISGPANLAGVPGSF